MIPGLVRRHTAPRPFHRNEMTVSLWRRWLNEERGQDIVEYALLASFLGFAAMAGAEVLRAAMNATYASWDTAAQSDALVEMPDPK